MGKEAIRTGASVKDLILEQGVLDAGTLEKILDPYSMTQPGISAKELLGHPGQANTQQFRL